MKLSKKVLAASVLSTSLLFSQGMPAFAAHDSVKSSEVEATLESISVSEEAITLLPGKSAKFRVYAHYSDGKDVDITNKKGVTVRSSSTSIVQVAGNLIKAGKKTGEATVTVSYNGQIATIHVTVEKVSVKSLHASAESISLKPEEYEDIELTAEMSDGTFKDVTNLATWTTNNSEVATVDAGTIEGVSGGLAEITASYGGESTIISVDVEEEARELVGIEASDKNIKLSVGEEQEITLWAVYDNGDKEEINDDVVWQPRKRSIVDVFDGVIEAKKAGNTEVVATYKGYSIKIKVEVVELKLTSLAANVKKVNLGVSQTKQVTLTATFSNGSEVDVTQEADWFTKRNSIADVDGGLITGIAPGTTTITAKYKGKTITIYTTVKQ